jgi:proteasome accessory factor B
MTITKTQRWLDLIAFLVGHRFPVQVDQVMEAVPAYRQKWGTGRERDRAAVRRMFERDKDELRAAGIPIETVQYTIEHGLEEAVGYRLAGSDFYLPYLRIVRRGAGRGAGPGRPPAVSSPSASLELAEEDAATAVDALRRVAALPDSPFAGDARSALNKLGFDLDLSALAPDPVVFAGGAAGVGGRETLRLLAAALRRRKRVRFRYHGIHRGQATDRDVAPYGLLYQHGYWYLIGHDAGRQALRVFRVGRMEALSMDEEAPDHEYVTDPAFDLADYARRQPWELGDEEPVACDVRFDFPLALWAERDRRGEAVEELAGGAVVRRFAVRQPAPFLRWLQSFAGDATVVAPPALRAAQVALARETAALYGPSGDAAGPPPEAGRA